ncbi:MAG: hypothetical protein IKV48_08185 [Eggerthellaceae bacterium]|nr:hypothetical protein [Eggerthellaceae bacterium]
MHLIDQIAKHTPHMPRHDYTFQECLTGTAPVPHDPFGKSLFQLMMAIGMTTIMVSFNGVLRDGPEFLLASHWMYPVVLCISLGVRLLFVNQLVDNLIEKLIPSHLTGFAYTAAIAVFNIAIMAPIMGCVVTMLLSGPADFLEHLAATMPLSAAVSLLVNLGIVAPCVKMIYHNIIMPSTGTRLFQITQRYVTNWAGVLTS